MRVRRTGPSPAPRGKVKVKGESEGGSKGEGGQRGIQGGARERSIQGGGRGRLLWPGRSPPSPRRGARGWWRIMQAR